MKKIVTLTLALVLVLGLTACGGKKDGYQIEDVQAMADAGAFSEELEELDGDTAFALYGLADSGLERICALPGPPVKRGRCWCFPARRKPRALQTRCVPT